MSTTNHHLVLDPENTRVTFDVRWCGVLRVHGTFTRVQGVLETDEETGTRPQLRVDVDAASLTTGLALRDRHLRSPRFLHSDLYPYISFRSHAVHRRRGQLVVLGTLSVRGVDAPIRSTCPIDEIGEGASTVELCGNAVVSRRRFEVGVPHGLHRLNPLFPAISDDVHISVRLRVPAAHFLPALQVAARGQA